MRVIKRGGLAMEVMGCDHFVVIEDRRVGIVGMVGTVGELEVTGVWFGIMGWVVEYICCGDRWGAGAGK